MTIGKKYKIIAKEHCGECSVNLNPAMSAYHGNVFTLNSTAAGMAFYRGWCWCEHMLEEVNWELDEPTKADIQVGQMYRFVGEEQNCHTCQLYIDPCIKIMETAYLGKYLRYEVYSGGKPVGSCYGCNMREAIERGDWVLCEPEQAAYKVGDRVGMYGKTTLRSEQATVIEVNEDGIRIRFDEGLYSDPDGVWYDPEGIYPLPPEDDLKLNAGFIAPLYVSVGGPDLSSLSPEIIPGKTIIKEEKSMSVVNFIKDQALKLTNPHEYSLRRAGLHSDCGTLTSDGKEAIWTFIEELPEIKAKLGKLAEDMIAQEEAK